MNRKYILIIAVFLSVLMGGCSKNSSAAKEHEEHSVQYSKGFMSMDGSILLNSTNGLHFVELETGNISNVCSVTGCVHAPEDKECTFRRLSCTSNPILYDGYIYTISTEENAVFSCKIDGSNLRKCYDFKENIKVGSNGLRIDNYFYYIIGYEELDADEQGYVYTTKASAALFCTDLKDGSTRRVYQFPDCYGVNIKQIWFTNNSIVTGVSIQKKSLEEAGYTPKEYFDGIMGDNLDVFLEEIENALEIESKWIEMNLSDQTVAELDFSDISEDCYICGAWDNKLLYKRNGSLYCSDMDNNNEKLLQEAGDNSIYLGIEMLTDGVLVKRQEKDGTHSSYEFYSDLESEPVHIKLDKLSDNSFDIICESDKKYYVAWIPYNSSDSSEWKYELIDKEILITGNEK